MNFTAWTSWSVASDCDHTCGNGTKEFRRTCEGLGNCEGNETRYESCKELDPCPSETNNIPVIDSWSHFVFQLGGHGMIGVTALRLVEEASLSLQEDAAIVTLAKENLTKMKPATHRSAQV